MEDRITPRIQVEMSDLTTDGYVHERVPALRATPGAQRITWWENCLPGRTDLPRRLPEFETLGLVEADDDFAAPPPPPGIRSYCFQRTARPGQGILSPRPTRGVELVLISPKHPERARQIRDWGDFVHIRDIAAASPPHFTMITPYENARNEAPRFMHLYELTTDDPEPAFKAMTPATSAYQQRAGTEGAHTWDEWSQHPELVIEYVSTFRLLGECRA